jgi:hypothetical protein
VWGAVANGMVEMREGMAVGRDGNGTGRMRWTERLGVDV